jgi:integrase
MAGSNKLSATKVESAEGRTAPYKLTDGEGLQLRVAPDGTKTWLVRYVIKGSAGQYTLPKPYRATSGTNYLSLADARKEARRIRLQAESDGIGEAAKLERTRREDADKRDDIEAARRQSRASEVAAQKAEAARAEAERTENLTFGEMYLEWLTGGVGRKDGNKAIMQSFSAHVLPTLGNKPVKKITHQDIAAVLRAIAERPNRPLRMTVATRNNLTQLFKWAEARQPWRKLLVDGNPVALVNIELIVGSNYDLDNKRDRILSAEELRELHIKFETMRAEYEAAPDRRATAKPLAGPVQHAIWIMAATLCRIGELTMTRWEHVNLETGEWNIPRENVKDSTSALDVFLSAFALDQFKQLHAVTGHTEWCFPSRNNAGHVCIKSMSKQIGDRQTMFKKDSDGNQRQRIQTRSKDENALVLAGGKNGAWTPHDLRRTGATAMQSLGVSLDIIDRCQNHVLAGSKVRRHYMLHDYASEKREAWRLLGERMELITGAANNVVVLERRA